MASSSRSTRSQRHNRRSGSAVSIVNVDEYHPSSHSFACIDLTEDASGYDVIDLTSGHSLIDSPIVVLSPADDVGPMRRRGSGRRGRRRTSTRRVITTPHNRRVEQVQVLSEDSDTDDPMPSACDTPHFVSASSNNSILSSPVGVKISCPVCMDDVKQIQRSGKQVVSTTCGHIFCDVCIKAAINSQHACPTCRKKLYQRSIHPLFL